MVKNISTASNFLDAVKNIFDCPTGMNLSSPFLCLDLFSLTIFTYWIWQSTLQAIHFQLLHASPHIIHFAGDLKYGILPYLWPYFFIKLFILHRSDTSLLHKYMDADYCEKEIRYYTIFVLYVKLPLTHLFPLKFSCRRSQCPRGRH